MCRDMGYPWAEGVAKAEDTPLGADIGSHPDMGFNPDYCPGIDDGIASECHKGYERDAPGDAVVVSCRGKCRGGGGVGVETGLGDDEGCQWTFPGNEKVS